jgi:NAD(P)-dependent dehydrogenase (short-subunit alcohol dehydrogenase family)
LTRHVQFKSSFVGARRSDVTASIKLLDRPSACILWISLARKGIDVIVTYNSRRSEAQAVVADITALGRKSVALQLDAAQVAGFDTFVGEVRDALRRLWERDGFDFLVNNAGVGSPAPFAQTSEAVFDQLMNIHLKGLFFLTQKLLPVIVDGGRIVNVSSGLARYCLPGMAAYATMKGGVEVLTRYLAKELGPRGIAVNTVAPGAIETDFGGGAVRDTRTTTVRSPKRPRWAGRGYQMISVR